ncbi:MAG: hypothetical protein ACX939_10920, partial [Hyphococcus sp.]
MTVLRTVLSALLASGVALCAIAQAEDKPSPADTLQVGPWVPFPGNVEEPFVNIIHASEVSWTETNDVNTQALYDAGAIDPRTGLPRKLPKGWMRTGVYFSSWPDKSHWAGDWVLEWETAEPNKADLKIHWFPDSQQRRVGRNRVEFTRSATNDHAAIAIERLGSPLTALRLFRKENEAAIRAGKLYNPRFIEKVSKFHVVRTMDLQETNRAAIIRADDIADIESCCWNNIVWNFPPRKTSHPFRSMPLEAAFALAVEADTMLWHHAPIELGAPKQMIDPSIMDADNNDTVLSA